MAYTFSPQGIRREDTFFDASGEKGYWNNSNHRLIGELDPTGWLVRQTSEVHNPANSTFYRQMNELEWTMAGDFPGGSIEVLRDGQRISIEVFDPGKLGIGLEGIGLEDIGRDVP